MAKRSKEKENIRTIIGIAGNKSQAITIPKAYFKKLGWKQGEEVKVTLIKDYLKIELC